jgi:diguanylate cyclase (GGDEF)-like protein
LPPNNSKLDNRTRDLQARWQAYLEHGSFENFVEFALLVNSLSDMFTQLKLPGLIRLSEGLENAVLGYFGDPQTHPIDAQDATGLSRQVDTLLHAIEAGQASEQITEKRSVPSGGADTGETGKEREIRWRKPRDIWLIAGETHAGIASLAEQLGFFGFRIQRATWHDPVPQATSPLAVLCFPPPQGYGGLQRDFIGKLRSQHPASQIICLSVARLLPAMVELLRAGADVTVEPGEEVADILATVFDIARSREQEPCRVLLVDDSPTSAAVVRKALEQHGIENQHVGNPEQLLETIEAYRPDLVLMDMHMPHCNGVEATRVMRQLSAYGTVPVVYLSSERDIGMQVEALRLGGDQFLNKPCNPLLLASVVKTKIARHREMQRATLHDGLTGLLNHSAAKSQLEELLKAMNAENDCLSVAMLDIDNFKSINDTYGHPVGDQVIRSLAWLLRGRLRATDIIGRYGGEEFLVVLRGAKVDDATAVLNRIRTDFSRMPHACPGGQLSATFSGGLASFPQYAGAVELTRLADDALLIAKHNGRNCIECAG